MTDARALAPRDYHAADSFERDCARIAGGWIPVARASELAEAGAQKVVAVAATPVLLTRDRDGALHALSNVCRHRGMTLVESENQAGMIRCPYHLWTYRLDGTFQGAPFMDGADPAGCDLPRYAADTWGGWVFVNLDGRAPPLAETLAPLAASFEPDRMAGFEVGYRIAFEHDWNWKVMVENFGESYHHIGTHAETLQPLWPGGETDASPSTADWLEIRHPNHPQAGSLRVFVVFPLLLLAWTSLHGGVVWYRLTPVAADRIALEIIGLYPPDAAADAERMAAARAQLFAIHQEDMVVCARVQAGLRSPDAILGPLSPLEAGVARFREWVARA